MTGSARSRVAAQLREPAAGGRRAQRRRQRVQPGVVLARDEVQRAAHQPGDDERAVVRERRVDRGGRARGAAGAQREPRGPQVLRLHREQARDRARPDRARRPGEPLRRRARAGAARPGSLRDEHAVAEVERVQLEQRGVAPRPGAALEVAPGAPRPSPRPRPAGAARRRRCSPARRVEVGLGPAPVGHQEAVAAVVRDRHRDRARRRRARPRLGERDRAAARGTRAGSRGSARTRPRTRGSHWNTTARRADAAQLAQPGEPVLPVVVGEHRHRRVERAVAERQRLGARVDAGRGARRALRAHHRRGLDRGDVAVARLVGAGCRRRR